MFSSCVWLGFSLYSFRLVAGTCNDFASFVRNFCSGILLSAL